MELKIEYDGHNPFFQLKSGDVVETERPDGGWYSLTPSEDLIQVFARFIQRVYWQQQGLPDREITDMADVTEDARDMAEGFLEKVCRKMPQDWLADAFSEAVDAWFDYELVEALKADEKGA